MKPERIVSLVPSLTEALCCLGLGSRVVGVTDYCVHPAEQVANKAHVGGTKDPDLEAIVRLGPDLVIANREENTERAVRKLREAGLEVWVTNPRTVAEGALLLAELAALGALPSVAEQVLGPVRLELGRAEEARRQRGSAPAESDARVAGGRRAPRVFCPIWKDPWMAVGPNTYANDMIQLCGGDNVFGNFDERRYPKVSLAEIEAASPEIILLPDEPYAFGPADADELLELDIPAARSRKIHLIDGTWVSWYGPRIAEAIRVLRPLLRTP